jgi:hypothetical protein
MTMPVEPPRGPLSRGLTAQEFAPGTTATSTLAAQQLGVKVGQIAKSLLFVGKDGRFFMVVSPGDVSTAAVARSVTGRWQEDPHLDSGLPSGRFSAYWKRACANAGCARAGYASRAIERHEVLEEGR